MKILAVVCVCVVIFHLASAQTKTCSAGSDVKNGICTPCQSGLFQSKTIPITDTVSRCVNRTKCNEIEGGYQIKEGSATEDNHCWCNESMGYGPRNPKACKDPEKRTSSSCVCIKCHEGCVVTMDENGAFLEERICTVCDSVTTAVPPISTSSVTAVPPISTSSVTAVPPISTTSPVSSGPVAVGITVPIGIAVILCIVCGIILYVRGVPLWLQEFCDPICCRCCQCWASVSSSSQARTTTFATLGTSSETMKQDAADGGVKDGKPSYSRKPSAVPLLNGESNEENTELFKIKLRELWLDKHTEDYFCNLLQKVGTKWKFLVRPDLEESDILALEYNHRLEGLKEIVYQAIRQWYEIVSGESVQFVLDRLKGEDLRKGKLAEKIRNDSVLIRKLKEIYARTSSKEGNRTVTSNGSQATGDLSVYYKHDDRGIPSAPPPDVNPSSRPSRAAGDVIEYENSPRPGYKSSHPSMNEVNTGEEGKGDGIANQSWEEEETRRAPEPSSSNTHREWKEIYASGDGAEYELIRTPGDGDCFFRSCVRGLNEDLFNSAKGMDNYCQNPKDREKEDHLVLDIRNRTVDHMQEDNVHYEKMLESLKTWTRQGRDFLREHSIEMSTGEAEGVEDRSGIFTDEHYRNLETEIKDMRKPGVYATHLEVEALARVEDVVIHVFQMTDGQKIQEIHKCGEEREKKRDIYLMYRPTDSGRSGHYDLLCRVKNSYDLE